MVSNAEPGTDVPTDRRGWIWIGVVLSPVVVTVVVLTGFAATVGLSPFPNAPLAVYAAANVVVVAGVARWLPPRARARTLRYRVPSAEEAGAAVVAAGLMVVAFDPIATVVADALGSGSGSVGTVESTVGAVVLAASSILVAPITEEVLYRGLALEVVRGRYGPVAAIAGSSLLFGGVHVFLGGASGFVSALLSGVALAVLVVRYDGLAGASLAHALNNAYWVAVSLGLLPVLVAV